MKCESYNAVVDQICLHSTLGSAMHNELLSYGVSLTFGTSRYSLPEWKETKIFFLFRFLFIYFLMALKGKDFVSAVNMLVCLGDF